MEKRRYVTRARCVHNVIVAITINNDVLTFYRLLRV